MKRTQHLLSSALILGLSIPAIGQSGDPSTGPEPKGPFADLVRASRQIEKRQYAQAEKLLEGVVEQIPKHGEAWHQLALARMLQGKKPAAIAAIKHATALESVQPHVLVLAARLLLPTDRMQAVELAKRSIKRGAKDAVVLRKAARILVEASQPEAAAPIVAKLIKTKPKDPALLYLKAELSLALHDLKEAAAAYAMLAEVRRHDPWPLESLASIQVQLGQKADAITTLERSLKVRPSNNAARTKLIALLVETKADANRIKQHRLYVRYYANFKRPPQGPRRARPGR